MHVTLGIDTGGTYTDAVLVDHDSQRVLAAAKAFTTYRDLSIGIGAAIANVFKPEARVDAGHDISPSSVAMVGLSTTLATNSIVEGQGSPVCLILIGYDQRLIEQREFKRELVTEDVVYLQGGHDGDGNEIAALDEQAAREAVLARRDRVAAFAVSGYFGVRNPAHELRVKALIEELTAADGALPHPVTCGHELTTRLNSIRRATTATLNARLIPILRDLILTVRATLTGMGINAPLMVVKGDGSLVRADWAMQRPIETILSGPAASVVGAWHIAGRKDVWVVDVGGTTTDIAALRDGRPRLNPYGAQVGHWRTMVEAADVHTVGLGGDSQVWFGQNGSSATDALQIGPRRALPLCRLAMDHPEIIDELRAQTRVKKSALKPLLGQFLVQRRRATTSLEAVDLALVERLAQGPLSLVALAQQSAYRLFLAERVEKLVVQQVALRAGFTPTDALHVLGRFRMWNTEASLLGAQLLAAQAGLPVDAFCRRVADLMSDRVATELVSKVLHDEVAPPDWEDEPIAAGLLSRALNQVAGSDLLCQFQLRQPVVAVGAPVAAYLPRSAEQLHTELIIPSQAGVANAVGAVAGSVVQRARALIRPVEFGERFRLHLPGNLPVDSALVDFETVDDAVAYAEKIVPAAISLMAREAGAAHVEVQMTRQDHTGSIQEKFDQVVFLETELLFTAAGRPAMVEG